MNLIDDIKTVLKQCAPKIIFGLGIAGMVGASVWAVAETPKACEAIKKRKEKLKSEKLPVKELVKTTYKYYLGPVIIELASIGCLIGYAVGQDRKFAGLATAYGMLEDSAIAYKNKVVETIGEKKNENIEEKVAQEKADRIIFDDGEIVHTGLGNKLFYDPYSNRAFLCDWKYIEKACLAVSHKLYNGDLPTLEDFYDEINLSPTILSRYFGWEAERITDCSISLPRRTYREISPGVSMCVIEFDNEELKYIFA